MSGRVIRSFGSMLVASAVAFAALPRAVRAQEQAAATSEVFRRFSDRTIRIQVIESGSAAKASLGTGFFVDDEGRVVTNYHVVSKLVTDPKRYRAEFSDPQGQAHSLAVLAIDVVNDLAVLMSPIRPPTFFTLAAVRVNQGARLYSLGHPRDLGLSIVEGTYNGLLEHTLYPKIHFTGALNPGMSGGPALADDGSVIGVNVATEGDEVSFLVPIDRAITLVEQTTRPGFAPRKDLMAEVGRQIREYQNEYLPRMFGEGTPQVVIGAYTLPTKPAPFFRCWADAERGDDAPYELVDHECSTDDYLYISGEQSSGVIEVKHRVISSSRLNPLQFAALYSSEFKADRVGPYGEDGEVTVFVCETRNVQHATRRFRTQLCLRRYRKLDGLYDAVLRAAAVGTLRSGLITTLTMSGVSFDNLQRLTRRYLEGITWRE